jgi:hypothetical protein
MLWRHNLVAPEGKKFLPSGRAITETAAGLRMWFSERHEGHTWSVSFAEDRTLGKPQKVLDSVYDALLQYSGGHILATYARGESRLIGLGHDCANLWEAYIPQADSRRWGLVEDAPDSLLVFYNSRNPVDGHTQAHISRITPSSGTVTPVASFPDDDYANVLIMTPLAERFAVCLRNRGAGVLYHIMGYDGSILATGSFMVHPHSRWAVPICSLPLPQGETLTAGWQEKKPGYREPWIGRLDADFNVLHGQVLPAPHAESAVTCLGRGRNGEIYALCPPETVYRLSPKGFPTACRHAPAESGGNIANALHPTGKGLCLITGTSFTKAGTAAGWLAALGPDDFIPLKN